MPFFSVVIPLYNRAHLVGATLDSVAAQTETDYEVVVVDDGSTDDGAAVVRMHPLGVRYLRQANAGPGIARNTGIAAARGTYVVFLDSDDLWFPWTLAAYREAIARHEAPSLLGGTGVPFDDTGAPLDNTDAPGAEDPLGVLRTRVYLDFLAAARKGVYVSSNIAAARREALEAVGGFAETDMNAEDHDLALRLGTAPGFVQVWAPPLVHVRQHAAQLTGQLLKTWTGWSFILEGERAGRYPGGPARALDRRTLMCQSIRSLSLDLLAAGEVPPAFDLYARTLPWQVRLGRWRYLGGFFVRAAQHLARRAARRLAQGEDYA
jgi:glycosyltransferase involved in cell wall biosynthesis